MKVISVFSAGPKEPLIGVGGVKLNKGPPLPDNIFVSHAAFLSRICCRDKWRLRGDINPPEGETESKLDSDDADIDLAIEGEGDISLDEVFELSIEGCCCRRGSERISRGGVRCSCFARLGKALITLLGSPCRF